MNEIIFKGLTTEQIKTNIKTNTEVLNEYIKHYERTNLRPILKKNTRVFNKSNKYQLSFILSKYSNLDKDRIKELLDLKVFYRPNIKQEVKKLRNVKRYFHKLLLLTKKQKITNKQLSNSLKVSTRTIDRYLSEAKDEVLQEVE